METYGLTMDEIRMASGIADEDHLRSMQNAYRELFVREETVNRKKLDTLAAIFLAMDFPDYARQAKKKKLKRKKMPGNSFFSAFSKANAPLGISNAAVFIAKRDMLSFACSVRFLACSASWSSIVIVIPPRDCSLQ